MQKNLDEWEIASRHSDEEAHHREIYNGDNNQPKM